MPPSPFILMCRTLINLYAPRRADPPRKRVQKQRGPRSRREVFRLFPVGALIAKPIRSRELRGQAYNYNGRHWRVRYEDNDEDELSRRKI